MRRPLPEPGSLTGANRHHTVRTDEHRAWRRQLLQVNQGNRFLLLLFFLSPARDCSHKAAERETYFLIILFHPAEFTSVISGRSLCKRNMQLALGACLDVLIGAIWSKIIIPMVLLPLSGNI